MRIIKAISLNFVKKSFTLNGWFTAYIRVHEINVSVSMLPPTAESCINELILHKNAPFSNKNHWLLISFIRREGMQTRITNKSKIVRFITKAFVTVLM